jgi:CubicO group peptidase (beta-lactamase class C family)
VLLAAKEDSVVFFEAYGYANIFSERLMTRDTVFDLASLTKPLATTLAVIRLVQQSKVDIEQRLESVLPEFSHTEKGQIKIRHLLGHNSGLPDYRPYYKEVCHIRAEDRKEGLRKRLVQEPLISPIGEKMRYSDLGFMILEWMIERVSGIRLDRFADKEIYKPLGLNNLFFIEIPPEICPLFHQRRDVAATEQCPWRNILLEGAVHDENAYVCGGVQGHAGLFGTAWDVYDLLRALLAVFHGHFSACVFQRDILKRFWDRREDTGRGLGFDSPSLKDASCGRYFSKKSVGHLGFTGTSFWIDPDRSVIVILLTNRVHPSRENIKIRAFRPELHDAVMKNVAKII